MAVLAPHVFKQYFDDNGNPIAGGYITAKDAGTSNNKPTYTTAAGNVAHPAEIPLSSAGRVTFWLEPGTYDFRVYDADDNLIDEELSVSGGSGSGSGSTIRVANRAELKALAAGSADFVEVGGYYESGDGGHGTFYWSATSVTADNLGTVATPNSGPGTGRWLQLLDGSPWTFEKFGAVGDEVTDDISAINNAIQAAPAGTCFSLSRNYGVSSQVILKSGVSLIANNTPYSIFYDLTNFASTVGYIVYGTGLSNVYLKGIYAKGQMTDYVSAGGIDAHGIFITASSDVIIDNCKASHVEKGIILYDNCIRCEIINSRATSCWYSGIGSFAHTGSENKYITLSNNTVWGCKSLQGPNVSAPAGIVTEETYFSLITGNKSYDNGQGLRIENSCNNTITFNIARENEKSGTQIYNLSKRNIVFGNQIVDNNTSNQNVTATTPTRDGNTGRVHSGIMLEYYAHNNIIMGNICYNSTTGVGFQKYGIAINNRNMTDEQEGDSYNIVALNQCLNNDVLQISDRGYFNRVESNITTINEE